MLSGDYFSNYLQQPDENTLSANCIIEIDIVNIIKESKFKAWFPYSCKHVLATMSQRAYYSSPGVDCKNLV